MLNGGSVGAAGTVGGEAFSIERITPKPVNLRTLLTELCGSVPCDVSQIPANAAILGIALDPSGGRKAWIEQLQQLYMFDAISEGKR